VRSLWSLPWSSTLVAGLIEAVITIVEWKSKHR
jgi:hypothetical protein